MGGEEQVYTPPSPLKVYRTLQLLLLKSLIYEENQNI